MGYNKKTGVKLVDLDPDFLRLLPLVEEAFTERSDGVPMIITSGAEGYRGDGVHSAGSLHYAYTEDGKRIPGGGRAIDLRIRNLAPGKAQAITDYMNDRLGYLGIQAVLERAHIHVEWDVRHRQILT